jgi:hypothetical protein
MSKFDYEGMRQLAQSLIGDAGMPAVLRREAGSPVDRPCLACVYDYQPRPRETKLVLPVERRVLISAFDPDGEVLVIPPDFEQDRLVVLQQPLTSPPVELDVLRFLAPAKVYSPAGLVVMYELQVQA